MFSMSEVWFLFCTQQLQNVFNKWFVTKILCRDSNTGKNIVKTTILNIYLHRTENEQINSCHFDRSNSHKECIDIWHTNIVKMILRTCNGLACNALFLSYYIKMSTRAVQAIYKYAPSSMCLITLSYLWSYRR